MDVMLASDRQIEIIKRAMMHLSINLSPLASLTLEPIRLPTYRLAPTISF